MTPPDVDKITALIVALNKNTAQEKIVWRVTSPPSSLIKGTQAEFPLFLRTEYKGQNFTLYLCRSLESEPLTFDSATELQTYTLLPSFLRKKPEKTWKERIVLAILDNQGHVLWEEDSRQSALSDLLDTVRRKISKIEAILDAVLSDDDETPLPLSQ